MPTTKNSGNISRENENNENNKKMGSRSSSSLLNNDDRNRQTRQGNERQSDNMQRGGHK